jgi:hypothetical protein
MKIFKNLLFAVIILSILSTACRKKEETTTLDEVVDVNSVKLKQGVLSDGDASHRSAGQVEVFQTGINKTLQFTNFVGSTKPDVRVYLSTQATNIGTAVELGPVKATQGNFNYMFDNQLDLSNYKYVVLWCKQFGVLFGKAELINP